MSTSVDRATDEVVHRLATSGVEVVRLDTERLPMGAIISTEFEAEAASIGGKVTPRVSVDRSRGLERAASVWYRRFRAPPIAEGTNEGVYEFCVRESRAAVIGTLLAMDCPMMSSPDRVWAAENKPFQLATAQRFGLEVPPTLITNDPEEVVDAFRVFEGQMIAKPVRTGFVDLGAEQRAIYTSAVLEEHLSDRSSLRSSPVIYQPLIPKRCDVRVTVVGDQLFSAEIDSQADPAATVDWRRTQDPDLAHRRVALPVNLERCLLRFVRGLGLTFGAIDLIHAKSGDYLFLEVNPNGQWLWLDDKLELGISEAVANWLAEPRDE